MTKYLLDMGHKDLLGIFKADDLQGQERHKGYVKALQEAGFSYDPDRVIWFHTEDRKTKAGPDDETASGSGPSCRRDRVLQ